MVRLSLRIGCGNLLKYDLSTFATTENGYWTLVALRLRPVNMFNTTKSKRSICWCVCVCVCQVFSLFSSYVFTRDLLSNSIYVDPSHLITKNGFGNNILTSKFYVIITIFSFLYIFWKYSLAFITCFYIYYLFYVLFSILFYLRLDSLILQLVVCKTRKKSGNFKIHRTFNKLV